MAEETRCVLRLYGAPQGRLAAAVALFAPQWRAEAQWKSRGAETLLAVHADTPTGLNVLFCPFHNCVRNKKGFEVPQKVAK